MRWRHLRGPVVTAACALAVLGASTGYAASLSAAPPASHLLNRVQLDAATVTSLPGSVRAVCVNPSNGDVAWFEISNVPHQCADKLLLITWGTQGPAGPQGPKGNPGTPGTDATTSTKSYDLGAVSSVPTGGSFAANATQVGTVSLAAGTYLVDVNAKATPPSGGTGAVQVFPEFFVYNQAKNASFTGDLFNVGAGALESGAHATIDSYYSGSDILVIPAGGETLHVLAFGYDSDQGAGSYVLDDLNLTATLLTTS